MANHFPNKTLWDPLQPAVRDTGHGLPTAMR